MHDRKKGGVRKTKKVARMREDIEERKANAGEETPSTDQPDIQSFKPGGPSDRTTQPGPNYKN